MTGDFPMCINVKYCADIKYGPEDRNRFDIWLIDSDVPTPLVIFYHGGGFVGGDKCDYEPEDLNRFLQAGVSFATVNYRYHTEHDQGLLGSLNDCRRALQWIRHNAPKLNIDKTKVGAYGTSAGAGTSLWIAFHKDMANNNVSAEYLKESTQLQVVGALATQSTYDIVKWPDILPVPSSLMEDLLNYAVKCYKLSEIDDLYDSEGMDIRNKLDFLSMMSKDAPPMYVRNATANCLTNVNEILHHPLHAKRLREQADAVGLQSYYVDAPAVNEIPDQNISLIDFFMQYLLP